MEKIIVFDVDGVLLDSMAIWDNSANSYLKEVYHIIAPADLDQKCATMSLLESGEYIRSLYPQIQETARQLADGVAAFIREKYIRVPGKPGMEQTIRKLCERGYKLYLATASEEENVKGALTNLGVWECFQDIFTCIEIGYSKNYTEYYEEVAKRIGVSCNALIMVEDSLHSMKTAKKAGLTVFGVYEEFSASDWEEIQQICDKCFMSLKEMID